MLCPISHKEFNEFIKGKGFEGRNEYKLKDLKAKFGFKPIYDRRTLTISSEGMSPTTFDSLRKAASSTGISYGILRYAKNKERNFVGVDEKIYNINWCNWQYLSSWINITWSLAPLGPTRPEHNQEATLYPQELTSTLLIQIIFPVHLLNSTSPDYQVIPLPLSICKFP